MTVRLGVVGTGYIARQHLAHLVEDPGAEVVALCDTDAGTAEACRAAVVEAAGEGAPGVRALAAAAVHADARRMIEREALDAVLVCLPPFAHGEAETAAVEARLGLFVEKPVSLDLALARRVEDAIARHGLVGASGYQSRYSELVAHVRQLLDGRRVTMTMANRFTRLPDKVWYRQQALSGGQITEMATHQIDLLRCLAGEVRTVYAAGGRLLATSEPTDVLDVHVATLTYASGAVGTVAANLVSRHGTPAHARGIHVFADGLTVSVLGHEGERRVVQAVQDGERTEWTFEDSSMRAQMRAFVEAVRDGRPDLVRSSYGNGVRTLAVTLALQESAESGRPVDVDAPREGHE